MTEKHHHQDIWKKLAKFEKEINEIKKSIDDLKKLIDFNLDGIRSINQIIRKFECLEKHKGIEF